MLLKDASTSALNATFVGVAGYLGASFCEMTVAAAVGGVGTMAGACLIGGLALYVPTIILKQSLNYLRLLPETLSSAIDIAYYVGSAALGAAFLGLAIQPFLSCAAVGLVMCGIVLALCSGEEVQPPVQAQAQALPINHHQHNYRGMRTGHVFFDFGSSNNHPHNHENNEPYVRVVQLD